MKTKPHSIGRWKDFQNKYGLAGVCLTRKSKSFRLRFVLFTTIRSADFPLFPSSPARSNSILGQNWVRNRGIPILLVWR